MKIDADIFREYDIRGTVGGNLTEREIAIVCNAYSTFMKKRNKGKTGSRATDVKWYNAED